jgi:hypothetical protein
LHLDDVRSISDQESLEKTADYLLKESRLTGPVHALLTHKGPIPEVVGIDDKVAYQANVEASVASLAHGQALKKRIQRLAGDELRKGRSTVSRSLFSLEEAISSFEKGDLGLGELISILETEATRFSIKGEREQIKLFTNALKLEKHLDFGRVERDRDAFFKYLISRLPAPDLKTLMDMGSNQKGQ